MIENTKLPYFLVIPDEMKNGSELIFESLNRENDREGNIESFDVRSTLSALGTATRILKSVKDAPIVVPILPSRDGEAYYQQLSRDSLVAKAESERIDMQCLECIESAKKNVKEITGKSIADKIFLNGYSASGVFAQRFALIHPEIVNKCCVGGSVGSIPIPEDELPYPCGIKDFEELFGQEFDDSSYKQIDFAYYVGEHEASRPGNWDIEGNAIRKDEHGSKLLKTQIEAPMHDMSYHARSINAEIGIMQREKYGKTLQDRFENAIDYYNKNGYNFKSKIFRDVAHNDVRYKDMGVDDPNIRNDVAHFGIFSNYPSVVDVSQRLFDDIATFYESGNGFEQDDKSVQKLDMSEQEKREAQAKDRAETKLEQLESEQKKLVGIYADKKNEYEQGHNQEKGRETNERTQ